MRAKEILTEAAPTFYGSQCTIDCSGHRAGYEWGMMYPERGCDSHSPSFTKGCLIAKEHLRSGKPD